MNKIAEQKALEAYPKSNNDNALITVKTFNVSRREGYIKGYDQAIQDIEKQVEDSVIKKSNGEVTIEDLVAYNQGFKIGRELAMQDFMEKAEEFFKSMYETMGKPNLGDKTIKLFKNYMQDEM